MQSITINLAGRQYDIEKKPIRANREWRKNFDEPIGKILGAAKAIKKLTGEEWDNPQQMMGAVAIALASHVDELTEVLLGSVDTITEAVFAYSPTLASEREFIEANGYDDEMVRAFLEVAQLAFPFSSVIKTVMNLGSMEGTTSQSLPEQNGKQTKTT